MTAGQETVEQPAAPSSGCIIVAAFEPDLERFRAQLTSLAAQTVTRWHCLIVADGHPDEILRMVQSSVPGDPRFRVVGYHSRVGFYRNFERGLQSVDTLSRWVALCDQDDEWYPRKLEVLLPLLDDATLVEGQAVVTRGGHIVGLTTRRSVTLDGLMIDNQITGSFSVFRRALLDTALPFPSESPVSFHDHWLGICAQTVGTIEVQNEALQAYVQHDNNVIGELGPVSMRHRLATLMDRDRDCGWGEVLVRHRLGWRREMANTLSARLAPFHPGLAELGPWRTGRWGLVGRITKAVLARQAPVARAGGLAAAAVMSDSGWESQ